jgi:hypothetical protein
LYTSSVGGTLVPVYQVSEEAWFAHEAGWHCIGALYGGNPSSFKKWIWLGAPSATVDQVRETVDLTKAEVSRG